MIARGWGSRVGLAPQVRLPPEVNRILYVRWVRRAQLVDGAADVHVMVAHAARARVVEMAHADLARRVAHVGAHLVLRPAARAGRRQGRRGSPFGVWARRRTPQLLMPLAFNLKGQMRQSCLENAAKMRARF